MTIRDAVLLLVAGFFLAGSILFFPFTVDDAFIVARYAVNARDLREWAFNAGEHVSALTSPLHGLLMIGLSWMGDPVPVYKVVSVLTVAAASAIAVRRYGLDRPEAPLVAVVVVAPGMLLWTAAGLETPILMAIVTAMATVYATGSPGDPRPVVTLGILAGAAVLTRYDAVLFAGPVLLAAIVTAPFRYALSATAVAAMPVLAWFVYSSMRFGSILPTSFFVKMPTGALDVIAVNVRYMAEQLAIDGVAIVAAYVAARLIVSGRAGAALLDEFRTRGGLHIALAAVLTYGATMATVHMMFAFRHFVPYLGAAAIALAYVARRADGPDNRPNPATSSWATVCALMILTLHAFQAHALYYHSLQGLGTRGEYEAQGAAGYARDFVPAMQRNAADVRAHWAALKRGRQPRVWTFAAGALPYAYRDAYIFEELVSYRHLCPLEEGSERSDGRVWRAHADYIHAFTRHGSPGRLVSPVRLQDLQLISEEPIHFNGRDEKLLVFFNPAPQPNLLPSRIDLPCAADAGGD